MEFQTINLKYTLGNRSTRKKQGFRMVHYTGLYNKIEITGQSFTAIGNLSLLDNKNKIGLLCSRRCPAGIILEAYEKFKEWATEHGLTVISGFHSPVERECFRVLLEGKCNMIFIPARGIKTMRIKKEWQDSITNGRLLIISPFENTHMDKMKSQKRNEIVHKLSDKLYIPYLTETSCINVSKA